jgi:serine/threonine protein kinase
VSQLPFEFIKSGKDDCSRFCTLGVLGSGSYGTVYEVHDRDLNRTIAIKVMDPDLVYSAREVADFFSEASSEARLDHPGIVPIYDVGGSSAPWFAMKRIAGTTLEAALYAPQRPAELAAPVPIAMTMLRVAEALGYAHARGIVHRDVKPANLLVGDHGEVWVSDWGLAATSGTGFPDQIVGSPMYMSPEQARSEPAAPTCDVYAFGAVLHELLTGAAPLPVDGSGWWEAKRAGKIVESRWTGVPRALRAIVRRCLAPDPAGRYPDASAVAVELRAFLTDGVVAAHREGILNLSLIHI